MAKGKAIYNFRCYFCHGYSGNAKTLAASFLNPPPIAFTSMAVDELPRERMIRSVRLGVADTAMQSFSTLLSNSDIAAVVDFVRVTFIEQKQKNTRYHTVENGWSNHENYKLAFPFALGEIALDTEWSALNLSQQMGKRLFMQSCVSCHDRGKTLDRDEPIWLNYSISFPRNGITPQILYEQDALSQASPLAKKSPVLMQLSKTERQGEKLFRQNCAFCHGHDGTGKNWIARFIEPRPRDFTKAVELSKKPDDELLAIIRNGVVGTAMPAWKTVLSNSEINSIVAYLRKAFF